MSHDPSAPTESSTEYDGFLSYAAEWHSLAIGSFLGLASVLAQSPELAALLLAHALGERRSKGHWADVGREVAYAAGGFVVFYVVGYVVLLTT